MFHHIGALLVKMNNVRKLTTTTNQQNFIRSYICSKMNLMNILNSPTQCCLYNNFSVAFSVQNVSVQKVDTFHQPWRFKPTVPLTQCSFLMHSPQPTTTMLVLYVVPVLCSFIGSLCQMDLSFNPLSGICHKFPNCIAFNQVAYRFLTNACSSSVIIISEALYWVFELYKQFMYKWLPVINWKLVIDNLKLVVGKTIYNKRFLWVLCEVAVVACYA